MKFQLNARIVFVLCLAAIILGSMACKKEKTEEEKLLDFVGVIGEDVEAEKIDRLVFYLDKDFEDFLGRDLEAAEELIAKYFERYKQIAFNMLGARVIKIEGDRAEMEVEVSLSSGAAKMLRKLVKYSGQCYRFNLDLKRPLGEWKIVYAEWRYMPLDQLFPESFEMLKEIFPKI